MDQETILDRFVLNRNAYFYTRIRPLSNFAIIKMFREASAEKDGNYLINFQNEEQVVEGQHCKVSICLYKLLKDPSFLSEPILGLKESTHGYVIVFDYSESVVIFRKNAIGTEKVLSSYILRSDYIRISRAFVDDATSFEKFNTSNMNTADNAIRNSSIEAVNLKNIVNRFGASKKILNSMRIENSGQRHSLALNTSRVNKLGEKVNLKSVYKWCVETIDIIESNITRQTYVDIFSTPLKFEEYIDDIIPTNVLFKFSRLKEKFDDGEINDVFTLDDDDKRIQFDINQEVFTTFNLLCDVDKQIVVGRNTTYEITNNFDREMTLSISSKSIRIKSPRFSEIHFEDSHGNTYTLQEFVNSYSDFIVNFNDPEIVYANRKLFKDHKLLSDIEGFMSVFHPINGLLSCTSEKGTFTANQTKFETGSLFRFIEDNIATTDDCLFCDDLGNEWADFIGVKGEKITFYHAKHKNVAMSATNFQDIVGQALKNLGSFEPSDADIDFKKTSWENYYRNDSVDTLIPRFVRGPSNNLNLAIEKYKYANTRANRRREVVLVIDFISYSELHGNLILLKNGREFTRRKETLQILWQISSLVANCVELGVGIRITCLP